MRNQEFRNNPQSKIDDNVLSRSKGAEILYSFFRGNLFLKLRYRDRTCTTMLSHKEYIKIFQNALLNMNHRSYMRQRF